MDAREAATLWFEEGDRAVAADDPRAWLAAFEQAAAACLRAGDPGREIAARLEIAAAYFHLERFAELERAISRLDDLARRKNLPEGVLVRARVFARVARSARERGEIAAFFLLVHQVRRERRPGPVEREIEPSARPEPRATPGPRRGRPRFRKEFVSGENGAASVPAHALGAASESQAQHHPGNAFSEAFLERLGQVERRTQAPVPRSFGSWTLVDPGGVLRILHVWDDPEIDPVSVAEFTDRALALQALAALAGSSGPRTLDGREEIGLSGLEIGQITPEGTFALCGVLVMLGREFIPELQTIHSLARNPAALALVLESAGCETLREAGAILEALVSGEDGGETACLLVKGHP